MKYQRLHGRPFDVYDAAEITVYARTTSGCSDGVTYRGVDWPRGWKRDDTDVNGTEGQLYVYAAISVASIAWLVIMPGLPFRFQAFDSQCQQHQKRPSGDQAYNTVLVPLGVSTTVA